MNNTSRSNSTTPSPSAAKAAKKRRTKAKRMQRRAVMIVSSVIALLMLIAFFIAIKADLYLFSREGKQEDIYIITPDNKIKAIEKENVLDIDSEYYLSLHYLADLLAFTVSGDSQRLTLSPKYSENPEDYATFTADSEIVNVGGNIHYMANSTTAKNSTFYIPISFILEFIDGSSLNFNNEKNRFELTLPYPNQEAKFIGFKLTSAKLTDRAVAKNENGDILTAGNTPGTISGKISYTTDISEYLQYIDPENPEEYLRLVSVSSPLDKDYKPDDLTDIIFTRKDRSIQKMRKYAAMSLEALLREAHAAGFDDVSVTSGYRDYDYQQYLFNQQIEVFRPSMGDLAEKEAARHVAIPGTSEHQSGLCIDMHNLPAASESFSTTEAYKWLYANCAKFGFILRFPNGKEDITGIIFEPWHYRYVGRTHALKIMNQGLCLEEYLEKLEKEKQAETEKVSEE